MLDDDGYAEAEEEDLVCKRFVASWAPLVDGYKVRFGRLRERSIADSRVDNRTP
jgi:hypothetical protein